MEINSNETKISGKIIYIDGKVSFNEDVARINNLTKYFLIKIATDSTGWQILFQDPNDGRYWEKVYLESHLQGGGPPSLINLSVEQARIKYQFGY